MKKISACLIAESLLTFSALPSQAEKYELNFQSAYAPAHTIQKNVLAPWCDEVSAKHQDLKVVLFALGSILEPKEVQDGLVNGMLDMSSMALTMDGKKYPTSFLANLPLLFESSQMGTQFGWRLYDEVPEYKADVEKCGHLLSIWAPAPFAFFSAKSPIYSPDDLKGKRVLIALPSDAEPMKALGAVPVLVTPGDMYVGLQRGMGEVAYTAWPMANSLHLGEVCKYATLCPFGSGLMPLGLSNLTMKHLPGDVLKVLEENAGRALSDQVAAALDEDTKNVQSRFKEAGCELIVPNDEQRAAFEAKAKELVNTYWIPYMESLGVKNAKELIAKAYAISAEVRASYNK